VIAGGRGGVLYGRPVPPEEALPWTDLRLADATTHTIAGRVDSVADDGTNWTLALDDTGVTVGDYPSRQDGWSWPAPAEVVTDLAAGVSYFLAARLLIAGAQPSVGTGYTITLGAADQGGDASVGTCRLLGGGLRWAAAIRPIATKRGGGGADVEGNNAAVTVADSLAYVGVSETHLHGAVTQLRDSGGTSDGQSVTQTETNSYTAPIRVVLYAGCDSIAGTGPHSLVFRPQVAWFRVPTV